MPTFIFSIDLSPFFISIKTGLLATVFAFFFGTLAAYFIMIIKSNRLKWILDGLFTLPLVLPPTVAGFLLLLLFSLKRPFGKLLIENFDIKIVQTWAGCVIAACIIAFPLMYRNARGAFEQIDVNLIFAARTLGISELRIFITIILPTAAPGIASGIILTFARAIGEYGATSMLAGNILGKTRTMSVAIASETAAGNYDIATFWTILLLILSFLVILSINMITGIGMKHIRRWE